MENFKSNYLSKCAELSIEPISLVVNILKDHEHQTSTTLKETLDLSGISISLKACSALSSALSVDIYFTKLILADAFLGDDGFKCDLTVKAALKSRAAMKI